MMPRSRQLSALLVSFCAALVLAAASCGSDGDDDADRPQPTTTAPQTTQSQTESDQQALHQLAQDWNEAISQIYLGNQTDAEAEDYLAEPYLSEFRQQLEQFRESGRQIELSDRSDYRIESVELNGDRAVVTECVVDGDILRDPDGTVINDEVQVNLYRTEAERGPDGWRLVGRVVVSEKAGESCAD